MIEERLQPWAHSTNLKRLSVSNNTPSDCDIYTGRRIFQKFRRPRQNGLLHESPLFASAPSKRRESVPNLSALISSDLSHRKNPAHHHLPSRGFRLLRIK
jgi:hypothetical protein